MAELPKASAKRCSRTATSFRTGSCWRQALWITGCRAPTRSRYWRQRSAKYRRRTNRLGVRSGGEGGTTPALAAVINAIVDALAELGVRHIEMPATPERVWHAIRGNSRKYPRWRSTDRVRRGLWNAWCPHVLPISAGTRALSSGVSDAGANAADLEPLRDLPACVEQRRHVPDDRCSLRRGATLLHPQSYRGRGRLLVTGLDSRALPSRAIELTAVFLDRKSRRFSRARYRWRPAHSRNGSLPQ